MRLHDAGQPGRISQDGDLESYVDRPPRVVPDYLDGLTRDMLHRQIQRMRDEIRADYPMAAGRVERNPWWRDPAYPADLEGPDAHRPRRDDMRAVDEQGARHIFDRMLQRIVDGTFEGNRDWYHESARVSSWDRVTTDVETPGDAGPGRLRQHQIDVRVRITEV